MPKITDLGTLTTFELGLYKDAPTDTTTAGGQRTWGNFDVGTVTQIGFRYSFSCEDPKCPPLNLPADKFGYINNVTPTGEQLLSYSHSDEAGSWAVDDKDQPKLAKNWSWTGNGSVIFGSQNDALGKQFMKSNLYYGVGLKAKNSTEALAFMNKPHNQWRKWVN